MLQVSLDEICHGSFKCIKVTRWWPNPDGQIVRINDTLSFIMASQIRAMLYLPISMQLLFLCTKINPFTLLPGCFILSPFYSFPSFLTQISIMLPLTFCLIYPRALWGYTMNTPTIGGQVILLSCMKSLRSYHGVTLWGGPPLWEDAHPAGRPHRPVCSLFPDILMPQIQHTLLCLAPALLGTSRAIPPTRDIYSQLFVHWILAP